MLRFLFHSILETEIVAVGVFKEQLLHAIEGNLGRIEFETVGDQFGMHGVGIVAPKEKHDAAAAACGGSIFRIGLLQHDFGAAALQEAPQHFPFRFPMLLDLEAEFVVVEGCRAVHVGNVQQGREFVDVRSTLNGGHVVALVESAGVQLMINA
jgi:hypothetical protein